MPCRTVCRLVLGAALRLISDPSLVLATPTQAPDGEDRVTAALLTLNEPQARSRHRRAFRELLQSEAAGSVKAALALAKITGRGLFGHPKNRDAARRHLERAAKAGSARASRWLAAHPVKEELVIDMGDGDPPFGGYGPPPGPGNFHVPGPSPEFLQQVREVLFFRQDRCPPCELFEPVVRAVFKTPQSVRLRVIDLATDEGMLLASRHGIQGTPTTVLAGGNGDSLIQVVGPMPQGEFEELIRQCGVSH